MWKRVLSPLLVFQLLLGVALVAVPVAVAGTAYLVATVPIYLAILAITVTREILQIKRQKKANAIRILSTLVSDLSTLSRGGGGGTHWAILQDLRGDAQFRAQMEKSGNQQAGKLLDERCMRFFSDVGNLVDHVRRIDGASTDKQVGDVITTFGRLLVEYRTVVQEFLQFLEDTKGEKETIQHKAPFSTRVHRELTDGYDRLMDTARQVREELRAYTSYDWLPDDHLTRFPRMALVA